MRIAHEALEEAEGWLRLGADLRSRHRELTTLVARAAERRVEVRASVSSLREKLRSGGGASHWRAVDAFFREKLLALGAIGLRRYAPGQSLYCRVGTSWRDAVVLSSPAEEWSAEHSVRLEGWASEEEGVALVLSPSACPGTQTGGILTCAAAMGDALTSRLEEHAGLQIRVARRAAMMPGMPQTDTPQAVVRGELKRYRNGPLLDYAVEVSVDYLGV